jgi:leukotriene-A4 hydrolase
MVVHDPSNSDNVLRLDIRGLEIIAVRDVSSSQPAELEHSIDRGPTETGDALTIRLTPEMIVVGARMKIAVEYTTDGCGGGSPVGGACAWLDPQQTAGKKYPYIFTQSQAIHARSILPCQDTPSVKATFDAVISVEFDGPPLTVVMAALAAPNVTGDKPNMFRFNQPRPVPSYLIAFAAGELDFRDLSPRCRVWAEPTVIESAASEFRDTEKILDCAEGIAGPYLWERYDLLCMPPSFPYGGMENANLTFVTPTLLAGDRSLVSVIAHEISHSWSGNLVSCIDWRSFWCNEGFTVYLERAIIREMHGQPQADLSACNGRRELGRYIDNVGPEHNYTRLVPELDAGSDPDDAFSLVPYEKGFLFLKYLEFSIGSTGESTRPAEDFKVMLREWFTEYAYQSISSSDFIVFFNKRYPKAGGQVDVGTWLHGPGPAPVEVELDRSLTDDATSLAMRWGAASLENYSGPAEDTYGQFAKTDLSRWSAPQVITFLSELYGLVVSKSAKLAKWTSRDVECMAELYGFQSQKNAEICFLWCRLGLAGEHPPAVDHTCSFLARQGRMKYIRPLYKDLHEVYPKGSKAKDFYTANRDSYHPIAVKMIDAIFKDV